MSRLELYLLEERNKLVWFADYRGLNGEEVAQIFKINRSTVSDILAKKPKGWNPKDLLEPL